MGWLFFLYEAKPKRDRSEGGAIINNKEENKKRNIEKEDRSIEEMEQPQNNP